MDPNPERDIETSASVTEFVAKLRRLADALESGRPFRIQIAGERFHVPRDATLSVEHEREEEDGVVEEEVEFQLTWRRDAATGETIPDDEYEQDV